MEKFSSFFDYKKLLDLKYILEPSPPYQFKFLYLFLGVFSFFILSAIFFWIWGKIQFTPKQKLHNKISTWLMITGVIGLILIFFRNQGIPYLSSRILLLGLFLIYFIWGLTLFWYYFSSYQKEKEEFLARVRKEKYLP